MYRPLSMAKHTAHIDSKWRKAAERFYNHLFMCPHCRAYVNAYCREGGRLIEEYIKAVDNDSER